ncbi:caspase family protein [Rhizobium leguminosarum]|uniref:caspase family protein n=1 Tax=Rhizobium leguminosarum TaxID=384 RepID=UPI0028F3E74A|nr:caspase family protein [Rhizobium leguminosarum]
MARSMAALLIGNANYAGAGILANPTHDAEDLDAKLRTYGFNTILRTDASHKAMDQALREFRDLLDTHEIGLFFFAGHGMQIDGENYLLAIDTDTQTALDAQHSSLPLNKVVSALDQSTASTKIIILDACRNNPWERAWHRSVSVRGLASVYAPKGTIIGFATSPGEVALDGIGRNGVYTGALLQHIDAPDCSIETMFKRVRNTVAATSGNTQTSWEHTSLSGDFYFNLSIGNVIDEYVETALADSLFDLDLSRPSHKVIEQLKTLNWYKQNPAIDGLNAAEINRFGKNSCFVVGRNIYQAACGSSSSAIDFIVTFVEKTRGVKAEKKKALLDGILFEIFFDSKGARRPEIKGQRFNDVFELQRHRSLATSFEFIANSLSAVGGDYYAVPGKGHSVDVTIATKRQGASTVVDAVYLGAKDILRVVEDEFTSADDTTNIRAERFIEKLSQQLQVPKRLLTITYAPLAAAQADKFQVPAGFTVAKE